MATARPLTLSPQIREEPFFYRHGWRIRRKCRSIFRRVHTSRVSQRKKSFCLRSFGYAGNAGRNFRRVRCSPPSRKTKCFCLRSFGYAGNAGALSGGCIRTDYPEELRDRCSGRDLHDPKVQLRGARAVAYARSSRMSPLSNRCSFPEDRRSSCRSAGTRNVPRIAGADTCA